MEYLIALASVAIVGGLAFRAFIGALRGYYSLISLLLGLPIP